MLDFKVIDHIILEYLKEIEASLVKESPKTYKKENSLDITDINPYNLPKFLAENNVPETCYFGMDDNNSFEAVTVYWYTEKYTSASQTMDYVIKKFNRVALTKLIIYLKENYNIKSNGKLFGEGKNSYKGVFKNIWGEYKSDDIGCLISYLNYYYIFE